MANVIMIGVPGNNTLYVADLEAGTVKPADSASSALAAANRAGSHDGIVVKGVDFAVAVNAADSAAAGLFDAH
ncbi:hypothetical protein [Rhizobium sp. SG2393]|uniref:hypothetical protein n=1 Tax=Rhizobium sp. SG2393 TaxID=3276279 RepID=UPI00366DB1B0